MPLLLTGDDLSSAEGLPSDQVMQAALVGEALFRAYPGHLWFVQFDHGLISVRHGLLSSKWGFYINPNGKTKIATSSELEKKAIHLGGELLERFNISRGPAGASQAREVRAVDLVKPQT